MSAAPRRRYALADKECRDENPKASSLPSDELGAGVKMLSAFRRGISFTLPPCPGICGAHSGPGPMTLAAARRAHKEAASQPHDPPGPASTVPQAALQATLLPCASTAETEVDFMRSEALWFAGARPNRASKAQRKGEVIN